MYRRGVDNGNADGLSRQASDPVTKKSVPVSPMFLAGLEEYSSDQILQIKDPEDGGRLSEGGCGGETPTEDQST